MSTWSSPYITVLDAHGARVDWQLPDPLPWPAGASADPNLPTGLDLGLPEGGTIKVRWRTPAHANPRSRCTPTAQLRTVALAADIQRAARAHGQGWQTDARGWPVPAATEPTAAHGDAVGLASPAPATEPEDDARLDAAVLVGPASRVSPDNAVLAGMRAGRLQLGATVADVIAAIRRERELGWAGTHKTNMNNVLGFIEQVLVYTEPLVDDTDADLPEVAAWMRARLALPGVHVGDSIHVALLLVPDLSRAIEVRRSVDRRVELLNRQAAERYLTAYARYEALMADRAVRPRGGKPPKEPAAPVLRVPEVPCKPRTEELFATGLGMILGYCEQNGLLVGPNPWPKFTNRRSTDTGYRRSTYLLPHRRNVLPVGMVVDIADAVASLGPFDKRTGRPAGARYRAMVLALMSGARPSEIDALSKDDVRRGPQPALLISKSASIVTRAAAQGDSTFEVRRDVKAGDPRVAPIASYVADAIDAHIEAGYASDELLFTSLEGQPLRWANAIDVYWRPAIEQVLGGSSDPMLRDMPRKWLRKTAVTWMLRAGLGVEQVASYTGHDVVTLYHHYAGVVAGHDDRHSWQGWDHAWEWAVTEHTLP